MKNKDFYKIAKEYFPELDEDVIWYIIWNETGYPSFFHKDIEGEFRKQLKEVKQTFET